TFPSSLLRSCACSPRRAVSPACSTTRRRLGASSPRRVVPPSAPFFQYSNRCYLSRELLQSSPNRARVVSCRPGAEREGCETGGARVEEHGKKSHADPASRPKLEDLASRIRASRPSRATTLERA